MVSDGNEWYLERLNFSNEEYALVNSETTVGRMPDCTITLSHITVSRRHCKFFVSDSNIYVEDLSSGNGIYINADRIKPNERIELKANDCIGIGLPVQCYCPSLEIKDHYYFRVKRKRTVDKRRSTDDVIDLTNDVDIKKEILFDLDEPIVIESDEEVFNSIVNDDRTDCVTKVRDNADEVLKLCENAEKETTSKGTIRISDPPLPNIKSKKLNKNRIKKKTNKKESDVSPRENELFNCSQNTRNIIKNDRKLKLKEIATKEMKIVSPKKDIKRISVAAKVTVKNRGTFLLQNTPNIPKDKNIIKKIDKNVTLLENIVLSCILYWNPSWLEEQILCDTEPPIYSSSEKSRFEKMLIDFNDYETYKRIMKKFLCSEIWNILHSANQSCRQPVLKYKILHSFDNIVPGNIVLIRVGPSSVIKPFPVIPKCGDMLITKFIVDSRAFSYFGVVKSTTSNRGIYILEIYIYCRERLTSVNQNNLIEIKILGNINYELALFYSIYQFNDSPLRDIVVSPKINNFSSKQYTLTSEMANNILDRSQLAVLRQCLGAIYNKEPSLNLVHGASGTGKTMLMCWMAIEYLSHMLDNKGKVILCSQSNMGADYLMHTLLNLHEKHFKNLNIKIIRAGKQTNIDMTTGNHNSSFSKKNFSNVENENNILLEADIIVTTLFWCTKLDIIKNRLTWGLIDDASVSFELELLCPVTLNIPHIVLFGDIAQSPNGLVSQDAVKMGFTNSMFSRISSHVKMLKKNLLLQLSTQHRMHPEIFKWSNNHIYNNKIKKYGKTALFDILPNYRILLINWDNIPDQLEAFVIARFAWLVRQYLIRKKVHPTITILTQNISCTNKIQHFLNCHDPERTSEISMCTIDQFFGKESDIVIISILNNPTKKEIESFCVIGLTRAKKCLFIFANLSTPRIDLKLLTLMEDANKDGNIRNVPLSSPTKFDSNHQVDKSISSIDFIM